MVKKKVTTKKKATTGKKVVTKKKTTATKKKTAKTRTKYENVILTIDGYVATILLNRPRKKNACSPALHMDMNRALDKIESHGEIKVIVVTGAGDSFCGGMDLEKFFLEPAIKGPQAFSDTMDIFFRWICRVKNSRAVTLASINGFCFGGGLELVGVCDLAIASEEAVMGLSEVNFGLMPGGGTLWAVANNFDNRKQALFYSLTGRTFTGKEAVNLGFVNYAVPKKELAEETEKIIKDLVKKNKFTLTGIKQGFEQVITMDFEKAIDYEMAKVQEMTYLQGDDGWLNRGLAQFKKRQYKPGLQSYKIKKRK